MALAIDVKHALLDTLMVTAMVSVGLVFLDGIKAWLDNLPAAALAVYVVNA